MLKRYDYDESRNDVAAYQAKWPQQTSRELGLHAPRSLDSDRLDGRDICWSRLSHIPVAA